jgi:hypothetical protein
MTDYDVSRVKAMFSTIERAKAVSNNIVLDASLIDVNRIYPCTLRTDDRKRLMELYKGQVPGLSGKQYKSLADDVIKRYVAALIVETKELEGITQLLHAEETAKKRIKKMTKRIDTVTGARILYDKAPKEQRQVVHLGSRAKKNMAKDRLGTRLAPQKNNDSEELATLKRSKRRAERNRNESKAFILQKKCNALTSKMQSEAQKVEENQEVTIIIRKKAS